MFSRIKQDNIFVVYLSLVFLVFILFSVISFYHILLISPDTVDGEHFKRAILSSPGFWLDLLYFLGSILLLHLFWVSVLWFCTAGWLSKIKMSLRQRRLTCLLLFLVSFLFLLIWSGRNYPNMSSGFMKQSPLLLSNEFFYGLALIIMVSAILSVVLVVKGWWCKNGKVNATLALIIMSAGVIYFGTKTPSAAEPFVHSTKPNIFIIGIDSLRPDETGYFGSIDGLTPNVDKFLAESLVFDKSYTPYARTFPAWMSVLTGQEPVTHKGRFNLINQKYIDKTKMLGTVMQENGYRTIYAFDERRFNSMDESFGYDAVVGPKIGALGFVLSKYDHPLVNLLCNTWAGKLLFPQMYLNRGRHGNYDPEKYNMAIIEELAKKDDKPIFLTAHFLLPHWPWLSSETGEVESFNRFKNDDFAEIPLLRYREMLREVDRQFGMFMEQLQESGLLKNAYVFLLSDHGDGFKLDKDILQPGAKAVFSVETNTRGHATNVLNLGQYRVLLAAKSYGEKENFKPGIKQGVYSLMDIYPTIMDILFIGEKEERVDGISLLREQKDSRTLFLESGFTFLQITEDQINEQEVIREGFSAYTVDKAGKLVVKDSYESLILSSKHRAIMEDGWMLAMIPGMGKYLVLVDVNKREWWSALNYDGPVDWKKMLRKMCVHYRGDIGFDPENACSMAEADSLSQVH